ncbi:hypothetical protein [Plantactinospora sp. WMMB782]|uniref:hypothetical protein n=1 Tax=Plantactinospora sp. WMMB782 TaxID=3404121 RepID=UPI003B9593AF
MRISEILPRYLDGVREVVDVSHPDVKLERQLRLPPAVGYRRQRLDEATGADLGAGSMLFCLLGADSPVHTDPDALVPLLRRAGPGTRAALLIGWPVEELPCHRLVGPLVAGQCQIREVSPLDRAAIRGVSSALVVERVDRLVPLRGYLIDARTPVEPVGSGPKAEPDDGDATELAALLRVVNEYQLADLVTRPVRRRLAELTDRVAVQDAELRELRHRLAGIESSAGFRLGSAVARGARAPGRALVDVPRELARVWRGRRSVRGTGSGSGDA